MTYGTALSNRCLRIALGLAATVAASTAAAKWSSDPAVNLIIADRPTGQTQPKIRATADGGFYVSWFGNAGSGYNVYLQRLDASGNELWAHNGVLLAESALSSTQDYGLDVDAAGNAILAYQVQDGAATQIAVSSVSPDGTPQWGVPGIIVSSDAGSANSPRVAATDDGNAVVAWSSSDQSVVAQKLDPDGAALWNPAGVELVPAGDSYTLADLQAALDGDVILSLQEYVSFLGTKQLWTQKLAGADGAPVWGTAPLKVFDGSAGTLQFGYFPPFTSDGAGGAVFVWYTVGDSGGSVHAQHVLTDGTATFAQNGVDLTTDTSLSHVEPAGAYDAASGDIYAAWRVTDIPTQSQIGINAQRIDSTGARRWTDAGVVLVPQGSTDQTQATAIAAFGGAVFSWTSDDFPAPMPIHAARLDSAGNPVWAGSPVTIKSSAGDTGRTTGVLGADGFIAYAWTDDGNGGDGTIAAQNINADGSLGASVDDVVFANGFDPD